MGGGTSSDGGWGDVGEHVRVRVCTWGLSWKRTKTDKTLQVETDE